MSNSDSCVFGSICRTNLRGRTTRRFAAAVAETLESRLLMTAVVVNSTADTDSAGSVTLRDAIATANASTTPTTITFDPTVFAAAETITLGGTQLELSNTGEPTAITGPAAGVTVSGNAASRVFQVDSSATVTLTELTIADGSAYRGGGIYNTGNLTVNDTTISGNTTLGTDAASNGGGVSMDGGTMSMIDDSIIANTAAGEGSVGGFDAAGGVTSMVNVTVASNTAGGEDGGIGLYTSTLTMTNVTVVDNTAEMFGGIGYTLGVNPVLEIGNSIVAGNVATTTGGAPDFGVPVTSSGHNLIGDASDSQGWLSSDLTGTAATPLAANLNRLADNGGLTLTLLPAAGSPVIGAGSVALIPAGVTTDQRGYSRTVDGAVDIGSVEVGGTDAVVVNSTADTDGAGTVTLRDAIATANASTTPTTITFDPAVFAGAQTITLDGTALTLGNTSEPVTVTGPAAGVTISGNNASTGIAIAGGVTANLSDLTITDCIAGIGAGISNSGRLVLTDSTLADNDATSDDDGGGIANYGTATFINDTIADNTGDGVDQRGGSMTFDDCTITGNYSYSPFAGAGIYLQGGGTATLANTIVAGNTVDSGGPDVEGGFTSLGNNLIGATDGSSGWIASDLTGTEASLLDPDLGSPAANGGPTQTLLPGPGSPAIGAGAVSLIPSGVTTDQRGQPRTINGAVDIGAVEVGGSAVSVTTLSASAETLIAGGQTTFSCSVAPQGGSGAVATGPISIVEGGVVEQTLPLGASGSVSFQWDPPTNGATSETVQAVYGGDTHYAASTSAAVTLTYLPASQVGATVTNAVVPATAIAGRPVSVRMPVALKNTATTPITGTYTIAFFVDTSTEGLSGNQRSLETLSRRVALKPGRSFALTLTTKTLPADLAAGTYYLLAEITDPLGNRDIVAALKSIKVAVPFVALSAAVSAAKPAVIAVNKFGIVTITVADIGNVSAVGTLVITVTPSTDGINAATGGTPVTISKRVTLQPGKSGKFGVKFKVPASLAAGLYHAVTAVSLDGASTSAVGSPFTAK